MDIPPEIDLQWLSSMQVPPPPPYNGPEMFGAASRINHARRTDVLHAWSRQDPDSAVIRYRDALAAVPESGVSRSVYLKAKTLANTLRPAAEAEWSAALTAWERGTGWAPPQAPKPKKQPIGKW